MSVGSLQIKAAVVDKPFDRPQSRRSWQRRSCCTPTSACRHRRVRPRCLSANPWTSSWMANGRGGGGGGGGGGSRRRKPRSMEGRGGGTRRRMRRRMRRRKFLEQRSLVEVPGADVSRFPADQSGGRRQALRQASAETGSTRGVSAEYCTCGQKLRLIDAASFERNVFDARYCIHGSSVRACPNECRIFV